MWSGGLSELRGSIGADKRREYGATIGFVGVGGTEEFRTAVGGFWPDRMLEVTKEKMSFHEQTLFQCP